MSLENYQEESLEAKITISELTIYIFCIIFLISTFFIGTARKIGEMYWSAVYGDLISNPIEEKLFQISKLLNLFNNPNTAEVFNVFSTFLEIYPTAISDIIIIISDGKTDWHFNLVNGMPLQWPIFNQEVPIKAIVYFAPLPLNPDYLDQSEQNYFNDVGLGPNIELRTAIWFDFQKKKSHATLTLVGIPADDSDIWKTYKIIYSSDGNIILYNVTDREEHINAQYDPENLVHRILMSLLEKAFRKSLLPNSELS